MNIENIFNIKKGYLENLMMKVNGKYGGSNQTLEKMAFSNLGFNPSKTMVMGIDVNHPGAAEVSNESCQN